jgi:UDP-glucose 4-epimerase
MNAVLRGEPTPVFGDGQQTRAFSHIADVAPIIARSPMVEASVNETVNVGADQPYSVLELAQQIATTFGVQAQVDHLPARNEVVHAFLDHAKVNDAFEPGPPIDLSEGIERMVAWVKEHGSRNPIDFITDIEITRNLSWRR